MNANGRMSITKRVGLTLIFPVLMFFVMLLITASNEKCYVNGQLIFLSSDLILQTMRKTCMTVCVALAIWLQLKNGRFDFSGGACMILTAIIAGNITSITQNPWLGWCVAIVVAVGLSCCTAMVYIVGYLPIIICTIGMTLLYESLTYLVFDGQGVVAMFSDLNLSLFGRFPGIFLPALVAIAAFAIFDQYTAAGRKAKILSNNQKAGVNIGINERKNIIVSYIFTGIIIGCAAIIYASQNKVSAQSGLSTSSIMFSYIVPVFMGMFIGMASNDVIGILVASIAMEIMNYGLNCMNLGAGGWQQIIMGVFVLCFYTFQAQLGNIMQLVGKLKKRVKQTA